MIKPDYQQGSIVNLMASILQGLGGHTNHHSPITELHESIFTATQNIVLIVIDGLGYHYLTKQAPNSTFYKFLQRKLTSVFPSTTATAITTFMTGLAPQQHGLTGWFTYFKELDNILTVLPAVLRNKSGPNSEQAIDINTLYGHTPVFDLLEHESYIVSPRYIAYSDFSLSHCGKAKIVPYDNLEQCFNVTGDIIKTTSNKKYVYTYWPYFDALAHEKGVKSEAVLNHFHEIDAAFNHLLGSIKGSNSLVIVTADHGIIDSGPEHCIELEQHPELQSMLNMPLSGERRMAYCYVNPEQRNHFTQYVNKYFTNQITVHSSQQLLEQNYYGLGSPHPQLHKRIGDYTLAMNRNYTIMDTVAGEKTFYHIGTHGGLSEEEMWVPLILAQI